MNAFFTTYKIGSSLLVIKIYIVNMTIAIGQNQDRSTFDLIDDWLKRDRFVFVISIDCL